MPLLSRLSSLWRNLFQKAQKEQELTEEIDSYLEMVIEQKIEQGLDPAEARRAALIELGGREQVRERVREVRMGHFLETLWQDLRYGLRMLGRNPGFTAVVALTLGLGIGANTAIFTLIDAVLLKMLPVKEPEQLVLFRRNWSQAISQGAPNNDLSQDLGQPLLLTPITRSGTTTAFSYRAYELLRDENRVLSGVLAYHPLRLTVNVGSQPGQAVAGQLVSGNYYSVLGMNAVLGRTIIPDDNRAPGESPVCVISHNYWQRRFAGDPAIVGKTIHLSGAPFTIIGVTPPEFFGLEVGSSLDISVPLMMQQQVMPGIESYVENGRNFLNVMGRLQPGVTMPQAQASLNSLYQLFFAEIYSRSAASPKSRAARYQDEENLALESGSRGLSDLRQQFSRPLLVLMVIVALVLAIACANVAGLLLARSATRRREIAIRLALGVGRLRLVRQLLTESLLLASLGALLGLFFCYGATRLLLSLLSQGEFPVQLDLNPDARVLAFTAAVAVLTGVLFGLAPAFLATRVDVNHALKNMALGQGARGAHLTFGQVFVIAQIAMSLLLLVGAGLFMRSLQKLQRTETGFNSENVLVTKLEPVASDRKRPQLAALYDELLRRVEAIPGVRLASLVSFTPMSRREWLVMGGDKHSNTMYVEGYTPQPDEDMSIPWMQVYPHSFAALGIPLVLGRDFGPQDRGERETVAVINESMVRRFFGSENPIGRRFGFNLPFRRPPIEIIGVVKDVKYRSLREEGRPMFYLPFYQAGQVGQAGQAGTGRGQMTLVVRTTGDPTPLVSAVRREVRAMDPRMPVFEVETLATQVAVSLQQERLLATLSSGFGLLALLLSCLGLYGILSYTVARRTNEIGIRMALGAERRDVLWLVLRDALRLVLLGALLGILAAVAAARLVSSQLFGISAADPAAIGLATLLLLAVAAIAGYLPARRATLVDPLVALRDE
jgi:predicted permease